MIGRWLLAGWLFSWSFMVRADTIGVLVALEADLSALRAACDADEGVLAVGSRKIARLKIAGHDVRAVKMGSGCVETALSAQALLARTACDLVISVGPAGGISDAATTGAWYRVDRVVFADRGTDSATGFRLNEQAATELEWRPEWTAANPDAVWNQPAVALASGERFIAAEAARSRLHALTGAALVDMNSAGLAAACRDHNVPLVILRVVSDQADEQAGERFRGFVDQYQGEGGQLAARFIRHLPPNPANPSSYPEIRRLLEPSPQ